MSPIPLSEIPVVLPDGTAISGSAPLVFIGPNGAGKTRFGVRVARTSGGSRIPALRSLAFQAVIKPRASHQAKSETDTKISRYNAEFYQQADEINELLAEIKAEAADDAFKFRDAWFADRTNAKPTPTRLDAFLRIWHEIFPGRTLDFSTYKPLVKSKLPGALSQAPYGANEMSDGERAAIYLINRVLRAPPGVLVIDEPEVHFHALLARTFWDTLEAERPDCRFVYITHDLPFALSRRGSEIGIVKSATQAQIVDRSAGIPADLVQEVLGAASLSLLAKRIVFTEGVPGASIDAEFYGA
jgi:ABC-type glutathione transport system ATPase component